MRIFVPRRAGVVAAAATLATISFEAGASAASIAVGQVTIHLGDSFPDPTTWALMLLSFGLIGAGVRSRKRSVVLA